MFDFGMDLVSVFEEVLELIFLDVCSCCYQCDQVGASVVTLEHLDWGSVFIYFLRLDLLFGGHCSSSHTTVCVLTTFEFQTIMKPKLCLINSGSHTYTF